MEVYHSVERTFDAGHVIPGHSTCGFEGHGHRFKVRISMAGSQQSPLWDPASLDDELTLLLAEVEGKSLNTMLPGMDHGPEGIAMWIIERMVTDYPKISSVEVWLDEHHSVTVKRPLR